MMNARPLVWERYGSSKGEGKCLPSPLLYTLSSGLIKSARREGDVYCVPYHVYERWLLQHLQLRRVRCPLPSFELSLIPSSTKFSLAGWLASSTVYDLERKRQPECEETCLIGERLVDEYRAVEVNRATFIIIRLSTEDWPGFKDQLPLSSNRIRNANHPKVSHLNTYKQI